jgi:hypothetical protein
LTQLYCRFTVHREAVTFIRYIAESNIFLSYSSELDLVLWKLEKNEVNILCQYQVDREIKYIHILDKNRIWVIFESGS